jgi:hypothetical protein
MKKDKLIVSVSIMIALISLNYHIWINEIKALIEKSMIWQYVNSDIDLLVSKRSELSSSSDYMMIEENVETSCHEMWLFIILRVRKSCINDRTIAKIMIIREEFYSKNVMWSVLRYSTCSDYSHILIWRWIILIELIWWLQSLSKNSIIIKTRNLIIRLTT